MANAKAELKARAFVAGVLLEQKLFEAVVKEQQGIISTEVFRGLVETTPVLTGRARRNWIPSLDTPSTEKVEDVAGVDRTGEPMTAAERNRIGGVVSELMSSKLGRAVHFTNNQPYVVFLDEGSSQKAPEGIRLVAVLRAVGRLQGKV